MSGFNPNFPQGQGQGQGMYHNASLNPNANARPQMGSSPNLGSIQAFPPNQTPNPAGNLHFGSSHLQQLSEYHSRQQQQQQRPPMQQQYASQQGQFAQGQQHQLQPQRPVPAQFGSSYNASYGNFSNVNSTSTFGPTGQQQQPQPQPQQQQQQAKYTPQQQQAILARLQQQQILQAARMAQQQTRAQAQAQGQGMGTTMGQADPQQQQALRTGFSGSPMNPSVPLPAQMQMQMQRTFSNQSNGGGGGGGNAGQRAHLPVSGYQPNMSGFPSNQGQAQGQNPFAYNTPMNNGTGPTNANQLGVPLTQHNIDPSALASLGGRRGSFNATAGAAAAASPADSEGTAPSPARPNTGTGHSTGTASTPAASASTPVAATAAPPPGPPKKKRKRPDKPKEQDKDRDVDSPAATTAVKNDSSSFTKPPRPGKKDDKSAIPVVYFAGIETKVKEAEREKEAAASAAAAAAAKLQLQQSALAPTREVGMERPGATGNSVASAPPRALPPPSALGPGSFNGAMVRPVPGPSGQAQYAAHAAASQKTEYVAGERERERRRGGNAEGMRGSMRNEIARLMYCAGDVPEPTVDTVDYVEDMLVEFLADLCRPPAPVRAHPGAIYTQPPLTALIIRDRLSRPSHPALNKYKLRFDSLIATDTEIVQMKKLVKTDQNYAEVAEAVGASYLGLDEDGGDGMEVVRPGKRGRPRKDGGTGVKSEGGTGERKKPGPKPGFKRQQQLADAGGPGAAARRPYKKRTIRERSGTAGVKGEGV